MMRKTYEKKKNYRYSSFPVKSSFTCFKPEFSSLSWHEIPCLLPFITALVAAVYFLCCVVYAQFYMELNEYEKWQIKIKK